MRSCAPSGDGSSSLTSEQVALEVLGVKIGLRAVRAGEFPIRILDGDNGALGGAGPGSGSGRSSRGAGKDASAALGADNMRRLVTVLHDRIGLHHGAGSVGRRDTGLRHDAARRHRAQDGRATTASGSGGNRLRMRGGRGGLRHHGGRGTVAMVWGVRVLAHRVDA